MALPLLTRVGPGVYADGAEVPARAGRSGEVIVTELHGKYYETTKRGNLFHATVPAAGVALAVAGTTAGFAVANPAGSKADVVLVRVAFGIVSGTYVAGIIMHGVNTAPQAAAVTGTPVTAQSGYIGAQAQPVAKIFTTATLPAAQTPLRPFINKTTTAAFGVIAEDVDGQIVLAPGTTWSPFVIGADTTPLEIVGITWEEVTA